jgi:hypothetical protein
MSDEPSLIAPPATIRGRLARNIRERRLLRSLLRLSIRARLENGDQAAHEAQPNTSFQGKEARRAR